MKRLFCVYIGLFLAYGDHVTAVEQHPSITRLSAQIVSQLQKYEQALEKLRTAIVEGRIRVCDTTQVLEDLDQAQETTRKALSIQQTAQAKKMFLLPTYLETAFERTIDRWVLDPALVPSDTELQVLTRYADSLTNVLYYLRHTDKNSLEESFVDPKSIYLILFSHCVVNSITLSLYTLKTKKLLKGILHRLSMLKALLEEYDQHVTLKMKDPSVPEALLGYSRWTQEVIERIVSSEISVSNFPVQQPWRVKVEPAINRITTTLGKRNMLDKFVEYILNRMTGLTISKPCFDYIRSLTRCIRECSKAVPLK
ncbi:hypothetical protein H0X06_05985 [Candidatus Dependentiae bacterium]|nr:hypothetical protein [Candidatus Dependentiae bacterium]